MLLAGTEQKHLLAALREDFGERRIRQSLAFCRTRAVHHKQLGHAVISEEAQIGDQVEIGLLELRMLGGETAPFLLRRAAGCFPAAARLALRAPRPDRVSTGRATRAKR